MALGRFSSRPRAWAIMLASVRWLVDLIEHAAIGKVRRLRVMPAPEQGIVDRDELHLGKAREIFRIGGCRIGRPVIIVSDELLSFRRVEEVQIGLRPLPRAPGIHIASTTATGGSALMERDGTTISKL